jgi:hypothetical protein
LVCESGGNSHRQHGGGHNHCHQNFETHRVRHATKLGFEKVAGLESQMKKRIFLSSIPNEDLICG